MYSCNQYRDIVTARKLRLIARKLIQTDGMSHQEAFVLMTSDKTLMERDVAEAISNVYSKKRLEDYRKWGWRVIAVVLALMAATIVITTVTTNFTKIPTSELILLIVYNVALPIYGLLMMYRENYRDLSIFFAVTLLLFLKILQNPNINGHLTLTVVSYLTLAVYGSIISQKVKMPYRKKTITTTGEDGKTIRKEVLIFE